MSRRGICGIALVLIAAGCSKPPSEKDVVDAMISWTGTGDMATQAWLNHTTFDRYTRETLQLSAQMLDEQSDQLKKVAPNYPAAVDSAATNAEHAMREIAALVAGNDAPDVAAQLDSLRAARKVVLAAGDSLSKQQ